MALFVSVQLFVESQVVAECSDQRKSSVGPSRQEPFHARQEGRRLATHAPVKWSFQGIRGRPMPSRQPAALQQIGHRPPSRPRLSPIHQSPTHRKGFTSPPAPQIDSLGYPPQGQTCPDPMACHLPAPLCSLPSRGANGLNCARTATLQSDPTGIRGAQRAQQPEVTGRSFGGSMGPSSLAPSAISAVSKHYHNRRAPWAPHPPISTLSI
jgi:hypothetical protein